MDRESLNQHLSQISTMWTVLIQAHAQGDEGAAKADDRAQAAARAALLQRYGASVYRYLLGSLRDADAADELFQEFGLRLVRGDFHRADRSKGRFRDFLKTALFRLIVDAQRRKKRQLQERPWSALTPGDEPERAFEAAAKPWVEPEIHPGSSAEDDRRFLAVWRAELLSAAWESLANSERRTGQPVHTVLRLRTDHPALRSADLAERLSSQFGRPVNAVWVRKKLLLARAVFTDALLDGVARSLADPTRENIEQELIDLGLLDHCREALARRFNEQPRTPGERGAG
ncbi:MAG: hypothetical protein U0794_11015 [Isosphaeraceae bacterium]